MFSEELVEVDISEAVSRCRNYRRRILDISQNVDALHIAPAFSCLEMVDAIYHYLLRRENKEFKDVFLMSKGHGCMIQYAILEELGFLTSKDLEKYCKPDGRLGAHPDYGVPGIFSSTGSLGHGLGMAAGMAYAEKLKKTDSNIYVVLSDGEFQEGSTWEAIMMAANLRLNNLIAFMDLNDFTGLERLSVGHPAFYPLLDKFQAFEWDCYEVDGHNTQEILDAVAKKGTKPLMIVGTTIKGKGVSFMENVPIWHYRSPNKEEYAQALKELGYI